MAHIRCAAGFSCWAVEVDQAAVADDAAETQPTRTCLIFAAVCVVVARDCRKFARLRCTTDGSNGAICINDAPALLVRVDTQSRETGGARFGLTARRRRAALAGLAVAVAGAHRSEHEARSVLAQAAGAFVAAAAFANAFGAVQQRARAAGEDARCRGVSAGQAHLFGGAVFVRGAGADEGLAGVGGAVAD